jgi:hypothetical protein
MVYGESEMALILKFTGENEKIIREWMKKESSAESMSPEALMNYLTGFLYFELHGEAM